MAKYTQLGCAACHGVNLQNPLPGVPSLLGVSDRLDPESVRVIVVEGRNNMRPLPDATNEDITAIYAYF